MQVTTQRVLLVAPKQMVALLVNCVGMPQELGVQVGRNFQVP